MNLQAESQQATHGHALARRRHWRPQLETALAVFAVGTIFALFGINFLIAIGADEYYRLTSAPAVQHWAGRGLMLILSLLGVICGLDLCVLRVLRRRDEAVGAQAKETASSKGLAFGYGAGSLLVSLAVNAWLGTDALQGFASAPHEASIAAVGFLFLFCLLPLLLAVPFGCLNALAAGIVKRRNR